MKTIVSSRCFIALLLCASAGLADIQVTVTGPGGSASQSLPDAGGAFDMNLPLTANAVNSITVSAEDASGNQASAQLSVTQLSLDRIVVSSLQTERLSTEEVEQLVADGVIDLDDPENYNVSSFALVLTVEGVKVPISLPIAIPINGTPDGGGENIPMPNWEDDGGGRRNPRPPPEIIFFAVESVREPGKPTPPPIPGVLIIEGKIRSLKELFAVRLMLLNTSGIFTLSGVVAEIAYPAGGLTSMLPTDGIISFGDIVPGNDGEVGQAEREFIVRGDKIGPRSVEVKFAGSVTGPGIPDDGAIPFSGSAVGQVDVKGPPTFTVRVNHPPSVIAGEPYDLQVEITNTGEIPAHYASLELDVSADARLADCTLDPFTGEPDCEYVRKPVVRKLGHLEAGDTAVEVFTVLPDRTGIITSCMGGADQNIKLKVYVGNLGCVTGSFPESGTATGIPTVNVLPANNTQGISIESPVVAFFSERMNHSSITTGSGGSFRVYTSDNAAVPGTIRIETNLTGRTLAIWQVDDGISNRLQPGTDYTVALDKTITDRDGNGLCLAWLSGFRTTTMGAGDVDAPQLDLDILPPVDPAYVLPGELVTVEACAVDQGSGVDRVELRMRDLSSTNLLYTLVDQKAVFAGDLPPYYFTLDSSTLVPGRQYQLHGTARDGNGNEIQSTIDFLLASNAAPPVVVLPEDPALPQLQGITISLKPSVSRGVRQVRYFLDGAIDPFKTVTLPPWNAGVSTLALSLSNHTVRAVATDGLGQTGEDTYRFELIENPNAPVVSFTSKDGEIHAPGDLILVNPSVSDDIGIKGMVVYLDSLANLLARSAAPILIDSSLLTTGQHQVVVLATNLLGVANDPNDPDSVLEFGVYEPGNGPPPPSPVITETLAPSGGEATVRGTAVPLARIDGKNLNRGATGYVYANSAGSFALTLSASGGDTLELRCLDLQQSATASDPVQTVVPVPPVLQSISVQPLLVQLTSIGASRQLKVTGQYSDGSSALLTSGNRFASSASGVAVVSSSGEVTAIAVGSCNITVSRSGVLPVIIPVQVSIVDPEAPVVAVNSPAPLARFNYGDTIVVDVSASDNTGVTSIQCTATGALSFDQTQSFAATGSVNRVFNIPVPFGVSYPDAQISVTAFDAYGNSSVPRQVPVIISDADITAPETIVTAVSAPSGTPVTLTVQITDGLDDLDHVEIYFRRSGYGTYNRYTDAAGGNALGHFPATGSATMTAVFDSTRMGGDGTFEFYSVGVDASGNREAPPASADQTQSISAGTVWTVISSSTNLTAGNLSFDDRNLRIDGATVTMDGAHSFHNLELLNGATLTHPFCTGTETFGIDLSAWTLTIDTNSQINADSRGYLGARKTGNDAATGRTLGNLPGSTARSGGSYGGTGGEHGSGIANDLYGDLTLPVDPGSGGSQGGSSSWYGGNGGGKVQLQVVNLVNDGRLSVNGENGAGDGAGGGSGGAAYMTVSSIGGRGSILANGGGSQVGGGGGRIAIHYVDADTLNQSRLRALGGSASWSAPGGNGTVFLRDVNETGGTLVVDGQGTGSTFSSLPIPPGYVFDNVILRNAARVVADNPIEVNDELQILTGSILTHSQGSESGLVVRAARVLIDDTSSIDVDGKGYAGARRDGNGASSGWTLYGQAGANSRSGGSYGGPGGVHSGTGSNPVYGHPAQPIYLGSGGSQGGSSDWWGGNGGGRIDLQASVSLTVNGHLRADGMAGEGDGAGGGSGGSIWIDTSLLKGTGSIHADGGGTQVSGGGGRIRVDHDYTGLSGDDLGGLRDIHCFGGSASWGTPGAAGTVLLRLHSQPLGDLVIDGGKTGATDANWTTLTHLGFGTVQALTADTLQTDGLVSLLPGGLAGLDVQPSLDSPETFTILDNSSTSLTVDVSSGILLTDVAQTGDTYSVVYRFDDLRLQRGGFLRVGDQVELNEALDIDEFGRLTHFDATGTFISSLELTADSINIGSNGYIDVSGRGYLGARRPDNDAATGRTEGNTPGSTARSGGSHGGWGGRHGSGQSAPAYDSLTDPDDLGGGGSQGGSSDWYGGDGGGRMHLAANTMQLDGWILANGGAGEGDGAGGGAGGTVSLDVGILSGSGSIRANGGGNEVGGGGGRIAIRYDSMSFSPANIQVIGGSASWGTPGGHGTLFLKSSAQSHGDLVVDGHSVGSTADHCFIPAGYTFDNLLLRNLANVTVDEGVTVQELTRLSGGSSLSHSRGNEDGLQLDTGDLTIESGSLIDLNGRGYRGQRVAGFETAGETLYGQSGAAARSGGSYGGPGGIYGGIGSNPIYGSPSGPFFLGSGGSQGGSSSWYGGNGGGFADLTVHGTALIDGEIRASGTAGQGDGAGGGSGGAIHLRTSLLDGSGWIRANGGGTQVGGGGGRIRVDYNSISAGALDDTRNITAFGGSASFGVPGGAGTVLLKQSGQTYGELIIDGGSDSARASNWTPLTHIGFGTPRQIAANTLQANGSVPYLPGGWQGLVLNPNRSQSELYTVLDNTADTLQVDLTGKPDLTTLADTNDVYSGVYEFDSILLRRGGWLCAGDQLVVNDTLRISEYGVLTHFDCDLSLLSRLDILAESIVIESNAQINVDARGYLGGRRPGNDVPTGRTLDTAAGSAPRSGGSHGGLGGAYGGVPNPVYGDALEPQTLGSGGSQGGSSSWYGGDGGGRVRIRCGSLQLNGVISSTGMSGQGDGAGGGSGGSILVDAGMLSGSGQFRADGGGSQVSGGGGRIALYFGAASSDTNALSISVGGGAANWGAPGSSGSIHWDGSYSWSGIGSVSMASTGLDPVATAGNLRLLLLEVGDDTCWIQYSLLDSGIKTMSVEEGWVIEFTDDLNSTNWTVLPGQDDGQIWQVDRDPASTRGFYRMRKIE